MQVIRRAVLAVAVGAAACTDSDSPPLPGDGARVAATPQISFDPASVTIARGTEVIWEFGPVPHNVVFSAVPGRPEDIPGENLSVSVRRRFTQNGIFAYSCTLHPGMTGLVTVSNPAVPGYGPLP
jgi:plastocyanin